MNVIVRIYTTMVTTFYDKNILQDGTFKRCCNSWTHKLQHLYQINGSDDSSAPVLPKIYLKKKWTKWAVNQKSIFFAFIHFNNFLVLTVTYHPYLADPAKAKAAL